MKRTLHRHHREALRDLLHGYIDHCEVSPNLIGSLTRVFYHDSVKYAVPAFTFFGPPNQHDQETRFVGIKAARRPGDRLSAEVTLQLLERLILQPGIGAGLWLRILPVINPVGLEKPDSQAQADAESEERLGLECIDGVIEIGSTASPQPVIGIHGDQAWRRAAKNAGEDLRRLASEFDQASWSERKPSILPDFAKVSWSLYFGLPSTWNATEATHLASQYLLAFFRRWHEQRQLVGQNVIH